MFYFVHKVVLLEQFILGDKEVAFIHFAFFYNHTAFADIPIFVKIPYSQLTEPATVLVLMLLLKRLNNSSR